MYMTPTHPTSFHTGQLFFTPSWRVRSYTTCRALCGWLWRSLLPTDRAWCPGRSRRGDVLGRGRLVLHLSLGMLSQTGVRACQRSWFAVLRDHLQVVRGTSLRLDDALEQRARWVAYSSGTLPRQSTTGRIHVHCDSRLDHICPFLPSGSLWLVGGPWSLSCLGFGGKCSVQWLMFGRDAWLG